MMIKMITARSCWLAVLLLPFVAFAQTKEVTLSGMIKDKTGNAPLAYVSVILKTATDSSFVAGTITDENGRFEMSRIKPGNYLLQASFMGYVTHLENLYVGSASEYLNLKTIELSENARILQEAVISATRDAVDSKMDKKVYTTENNISQSGGSVLQTMQNLPGVSVQDGKILLRGNDKIAVLMDGKQTALTGFGGQSGLDNLPASAIERIEIINNPTAKYDANGNAGIINIVLKKESKQGLTGKATMAAGVGALWVRKENFPGIRPQYTQTPKLNPGVSLNYRKNKVNLFLQADNLYTQTLNKNEFVKRVYDNGTIINQQTKRNRNTNFFTSKVGFDWFVNPKNTFTFSGVFGSEKIIDRGDEPFYNGNFSERLRLWQFLEDELKTTAMSTTSYQHKFSDAGHLLNAGFNYTFHRENEKYFFDNLMPSFTGKDAFKLISDEQVADFTTDYIRPGKFGKLETGVKIRNRSIPTNMQFIPGFNSPLDTNAGGKATYKEFIPAVYGNYAIEKPRFEAELGMRLEYVKVNYLVNPNHPTYKSDGYHYTQPFPTLRFAFKANDRNKITFFYNRRVNRPNEVDIRIFPKYDDAEIVKVGNPALKPQFTNNVELGYKKIMPHSYLYAAAYHKFAQGTITRIATTVPGSTIIYNVFQNAGKSFNTGLEMLWNHDVNKTLSYNINANVYRNQINAFSITNLYPVVQNYSSTQQQLISGNVKLNIMLKLRQNMEAMLTTTYLAPDIIPQGKSGSRFSVDAGCKKTLKGKKGEIFINATDLFNTLVIRKTVQGNGFYYKLNDYYETQVIRAGYSRKF